MDPLKLLDSQVAMNLSSGRELLTQASGQKEDGDTSPFPNFSLSVLSKPSGMTPHLGLSFPFGPLGRSGGYFQKPLGSENPELESWDVETVSAGSGGIEMGPFAGRTEALGGIAIRWPVVCMAGCMPGCLTPPTPQPLACLPLCRSVPAPPAAGEAGLSFRKGQFH